MNLPNKLTLSRIAAVPVFLFFLVPGWFGQFLGLDRWGRYAAAAIFVLASITDLLDGMIARKRNIVSELGKFLDPIADKLLVTAALVALVKTDGLSVWVVVIIIAREFIVTGLRIVAAGQGVVIAAGRLGKMKTTFQTIAIVAILIHDFPVSLIFPWLPVGKICMAIAVVLTVVSGIDYVAKNAYIIKKRQTRNNCRPEAALHGNLCMLKYNSTITQCLGLWLSPAIYWALGLLRERRRTAWTNS